MAERRLFVRLCTAGALAYCSYAICRSPLLPLFAQDLGAGPEAVGLIAAASTVTGIFLKLPAGALSDIFGRGRLLLSGAAVFALLPFAYLPVSSRAALVLLRFVHGSATAIFGPVASATLSDLAPPSRRGTWLGSYSAAQGAGQALGPVIAGALVASATFDGAFLASGAIGIGGLVLLAGWPHTAAASATPGRWGVFCEGIGHVLGSAPILTTSLAQAGQFFLNGTLTAFLPLYAANQVGLNAFEIGIVFGAQTVSALASRPIFGMLSDRLGRRPLIVTGLVTSGAAAWTLSFAAGFGGVLAAAVIYGIGLGITTSGTSAYVTDLSHRERYGAAHGVFGTIYDVGDAAGPISAGFLVAAAGYAVTFRAIGTGVALLGVVFFWLSARWEVGSGTGGGSGTPGASGTA